MKLRIEQSGLHYFDRNTGLHFLIDEISPSLNECSIAPRTFSIAITNDCNANCHFCHVPKGKTYLSKEFLIDFCKKIDELGSLDIAIGGGEPLLHPDIVEICKSIWINTKLGISITTNGQLLTESLIDDLSGCVSFLRISIDSVDENNYKKIRSFDLKTLSNNILKIKGKIPFGINMVVNEQTISELDKIIEFAQIIGAEELLLLPMIEKGEISLKEAELNKL
jgi:MoaA/NifB/PqqE/SkfB family radical SAM enzyme